MRTWTPLEREAVGRYRKGIGRRTGRPRLESRKEVEALAAQLGLNCSQIRVLRCRGLLETPLQRAVAVIAVAGLRRRLGIGFGRLSVTDVIAEVTAALADVQTGREKIVRERRTK